MKPIQRTIDPTIHRSCIHPTIINPTVHRSNGPSIHLIPRIQSNDPTNSLYIRIPISVTSAVTSKGAYTLQKIFHRTENFPRTACAVRFFLKKKSYCACGPRKIFRSVENFPKCICTFTLWPYSPYFTV